MATMVLRKSGYMDFYFNCKRVVSTDESPEDRVFEYTSLRMNFNGCILTRRVRSDVNQAGECAGALMEHQVLLDLSSHQRTSFSNAVLLPKLDEH